MLTTPVAYPEKERWGAYILCPHPNFKGTNRVISSIKLRNGSLYEINYMENYHFGT